MVHKWFHADSIPNTPDGAPNTSSFSRTNLRSSIPIPTGTVASRVQSIQSLSTSHSIQFLPTSSSQVLGGRHPDGPPASGPRKVPPNTRRDAKTNISYIGRKNPPKNRETVYTNQDPNRRSSRTRNDGPMVRKASAGRVDKLRRHGERPVHDSVSKIRTSEVIKRIEDTDGVSQEQNIHCDYTDIHSKCLPVATSKVQNSQSPQQPHRHGSARSESSITTTSTMRRLSVRELFQDYGVERPPGFASPTNSSDATKERSRSKRAHVCCHICSFTNRYVQLDCEKCGHHFCSNCPAYSTRLHAPHHGYMKTKSKETYLGKSDMRADFQHSLSDQSKRKAVGPDPNPIQRSRNKVEQLRNRSNLLSKNTYSVSEVSTRNMNSTRTLRHRPTHNKQAISPTSSKDISTAMTNQTASTHGQKGSVRHKQLSLRRRAGRAWDSLRAQQGSPSPAFERADINFIDQSQDGPKSIQRDMRNSNGNYRNHPGHKAVPSKVDQTPLHLSSQLSHPYFSRPHSRSSQNSRRPDLTPLRTSSSFSRVQHLQNSSNLEQVPELVECHGYPRTGHGQCGSPVEAGIVGECQHCVDDCECLACQSTPHNVRCCTHRDHPSIAHTHPMSQTISRISQSVSRRYSARAEMLPLLPLSVSRQNEEVQQSYPVDRASASDSDMSKRTARLHQPDAMTVVKKRKPPFKYPVAPIDKMGNRSSESITSITKRKNTITTTEGIMGQTNDKKSNPRQESNVPTLEQFPTPEIQVKTTHTLEDCPVSSEDNSQNQKSPFSKLFGKISHESLKLQAKQKEERKEKLRQAKRGANETNEGRDGTKNELGSMKQLEILRKEERHPYEEDKLPDHSALTALFLNYQIGRRSKRVNRPSSPLSPKHNRDAVRTLSNSSQTVQHKREAALDGSALANKSDLEQARGKLNVENDGQRGRFKTTTKGTEVMGITVIVHMSNKEDLFFHVDTTTAANR